jgi:hypothetical protein
MNPTGTLDDDGHTLVLVRRFTAPIEDVWASVVDSERLSRWFGTWSGDPSTGSVMLTITPRPSLCRLRATTSARASPRGCWRSA